MYTLLYDPLVLEYLPRAHAPRERELVPYLVVAHPRTAPAMPITNAFIRGFIGHLPSVGGIACAKQGCRRKSASSNERGSRFPYGILLGRKELPCNARAAEDWVPFAALLARPRHGDSCLAGELGSRAGLSGATGPWVAAGASPFRLGTGS
jgi:hypothetical protein